MWSRRDLVRMAGVGAAGALLPRTARAAAGPPRRRRGKPDFTVAFLSDPHVFEEKGAARGFADAVAHAMSQRRTPEPAGDRGSAASRCCLRW